MKVDTLLRNLRLAGVDGPVDLAMTAGRVAAIGPRLVCEAVEEEDFGGAFAFSGFVESHIHLDKACILGRCRICEGTLAEAVVETARAKAGFGEEDVHARASRVLDRAIVAGTTAMRSFVEVDPRAGMRSLSALLRLREERAHAIDLQLCAFAQEGLTQEPETERMLDAALDRGADLVGGCPYTDHDPRAHVARIFDLAVAHGVDVDFHLDFDLDPTWSHLDFVLAETERRGWGGRVTIGHVTKLSMMDPAEVETIGRRLAAAGVALTVLPATDLFLTGRDHAIARPRGLAPAHRLAALGVTATVATNNVLNPFTPYGDASLGRMANLYANVAQLASEAELSAAFDMVGRAAARVLGRDFGLVVGGPADVVVLDAPDPVAAIREIAAPLAGWKGGRRTFVRPRPTLFAADGGGRPPA